MMTELVKQCQSDLSGIKCAQIIDLPKNEKTGGVEGYVIFVIIYSTCLLIFVRSL